MEFAEIVKKRYATKKFDGREIPKDKIDALFELIRMSASSYGVMPWKVVVVKDKETKEKLAPVSWNQPQITTCSHLLVFCGDTEVLKRIDAYEQMMVHAGTPADKAKGYGDMMRGDLGKRSPEALKDWAQRQAYIALGNAINGAKSLGFDSCPMEGFQPAEYHKILKLPAHIHPVAIVTLGYAADTPHPKLRFARKDVFIE